MTVRQPLPDESLKILSGNAFKIVYAAWHFATALTIEDLASLCALNRETAINALKMARQNGYLGESKRARKTYYHYAPPARQTEMHLPSLRVVGIPDCSQASSAVPAVGKADCSGGVDLPAVGKADCSPYEYSKEDSKIQESLRISPQQSEKPTVHHAEKRAQVEKCARYSLAICDGGDVSLGFHIKVWAHAMQADHLRKNRALMDGLHCLCQELEDRKRKGNPRQNLGGAFNCRARELFQSHGCPMPTGAEAAEMREMRKQLRSA